MKAVRFLILASAALFVAACLPVTSKNPIGTTVGLHADPALIGLWKGHGDDPDGKDGYFAFIDGGDSLTVLMFQPEEADWNSFVVRTATLGSNRLMNVVAQSTNGQPANDEGLKGNIPTLYRIEGGKLTLALLDDKAVAQAIKDGKLQGTVEPGENGDVHITSDPAALDAFFATAAGAGLFREKLIALSRVTP